MIFQPLSPWSRSSQPASSSTLYLQGRSMEMLLKLQIKLNIHFPLSFPQQIYNLIVIKPFLRPYTILKNNCCTAWCCYNWSQFSGFKPFYYYYCFLLLLLLLLLLVIHVRPKMYISCKEKSKKVIKNWYANTCFS